jgi:hypothetical protein
MVGVAGASAAAVAGEVSADAGAGVVDSTSDVVVGTGAVVAGVVVGDDCAVVGDDVLSVASLGRVVVSSLDASDVGAAAATPEFDTVANPRPTATAMDVILLTRMTALTATPRSSRRVSPIALRVSIHDIPGSITVNRPQRRRPLR